MPNIPFPSDIPFSLQEMRGEFDRLLDRVWHSGLHTAPLDGQDWAPRLDVFEHSDKYRVRVEISGMTAEDVAVTIQDNILTIKGTKSAPEEPEEGVRRIRAECRYGSFCRHYEFRSPVDDSAVSASCKDGLLTIEIPKTPQPKGRSVEVETTG